MKTGPNLAYYNFDFSKKNIIFTLLELTTR